MTMLGDKVLVFGLGESGCAAATMLAGKGLSVTALDAAVHPDGEDCIPALLDVGVRVLTGSSVFPKEHFDSVVVSPGIPASSILVKEAERRGIRIIPEFEAAWLFHDGPVIAVTGSNGKSTTVKLIAETLAAGGYPATPCGNYGLPFSTLVDRRDTSVPVLELSSFQLEHASVFRPDIGVLLNLSPNHLDRHKNFEEYRDCKFSLFARQQPEDFAIIHDEWLNMATKVVEAAPQWRSFGSNESAEFRFAKGFIWLGDQVVLDPGGTPFNAEPLGENLAAAAAVMDAFKISFSVLGETLAGFEGLPHRREFVAEARGVRFVNDSKATTLAALAASVQSAGGPVRLIAGGKLKERVPEKSKEILAQNVRAVYLIGSSAEIMREAWDRRVDCRRSGTLENALRSACDDARPGETVLLAPGCSSFDQFSGYEERGERFKALVRGVCQGRKEHVRI